MEDGAFYRDDVVVTFNEGKAMLDGEPFPSGGTLDTEGDYTLIVTDAAGNMTVAAFTIDKTAPEITGVEDGASYNTDVTAAFNEGTATLNGEAFTSGTLITDEDEYTLVVIDASGNADTVRFTIDKTVPEITGVEDGALYNEEVTVSFNEGTATLNGAAFASGTVVTDEDEYTLVVTDAAGNADTVRFTIDSGSPVITGATDGASYNTDVTPAFNEGTATLNGEAFTPGTVITEEDEYTLTVTDAAGNATTVSFAIDKTAPAITGVEEGGLYAGAATASFNEGTATLNDGPYTAGTPATVPGEYTLTVTDAAGNVTTVCFTVGALPDAPMGLSATAGNRQVLLEWDAPAGGIPAVTDYVIGYSRDGGSTWTEPAREPSAATRSLVIGLENNRPYLFRVSAVNGVGRGVASGTVQAIPAEPVPDVGGNLPEPEPGVPVVVTDGKVEAVMLEVVDSEYLRLSGDGYAMELASLGADGERIPISAVDAVIRLLKGNGTQVYISGHGFEPGTVVTVYLFSNPELVGHLPVGADGRFGGSLPVPANLELGHHTLQANGVIAGGNGERSVSVGLELVDRKPQWVSFGALADRIYGDGPVTLEATATSGLAVTYAVTDADGNPTDIAVIENNKLTIHGAGEVVVTATQGGNADYPAAVPVSRTLHIARAPLSVRTSDATRAYGGDNPSFELTYEGFVNGDDAPALAIQPAAATESTATSAPGDYAITITGGESANYAFTYHGATLTITKASQAITLYAPVEVTRDAGSIQLDVSSSSGLPVSLTADDPQVAVLSGSVLDIQRLGTVRITATQAGDGNHEAAGPVTVTIRVTDPSSDFPIRVHRALSPNGDGINEYLIIEAIRDHAENRVTIFSRNGTLLWEASGYDNDRVVFRGISTGGQQLPAGTYFYIVEVKVNGKWEHRKGYFVIRY
ncbi:gliding motility-associated C-terminal domain-containing protein [Parapedobacter sp.]|uniref:T9SS type B sorting domain-containing protein n=1 Tax=Parapedobacter sp. TaxID=1958893 RepID=UPI002D7EABD0|nr:gliding motility-associated C-terminal domain-containing protein [Parapedobacter sp.]